MGLGQGPWVPIYIYMSCNHSFWITGNLVRCKWGICADPGSLAFFLCVLERLESEGLAPGGVFFVEDEMNLFFFWGGNPFGYLSFQRHPKIKPIYNNLLLVSIWHMDPGGPF